jgi:carbonic anhydrase
MKVNYIEELLKSNQRFIDRTGKDYFQKYQEGQNPFMTLVTCSDSRVQTEAFQNNPFNNIFSIRNIGNQIYSNEGSVDYGILHLKTPILLILGHTDCGAVKAFIAGYDKEPDSIKQELNHLIPAISIEDKPLFEKIKENLNYQVKIAVEKYQDKLVQNELMILGGIYDFKNKLEEGYGRIKIININGKLEV